MVEFCAGVDGQNESLVTVNSDRSTATGVQSHHLPDAARQVLQVLNEHCFHRQNDAEDAELHRRKGLVMVLQVIEASS